jgi:tRNA pseudouridine38-40 synthase
MRRIKILLSYDGTAYSGWQKQPERMTIQGIVEEILATVEKKPVTLFGSGRTDAGVHAYAQAASFELENPIPTDNLRKAINRLLPRDIRVISVEDMQPDFHARFDAASKTYRYYIYREEICSPFQRRYVHHYPYPLNEADMCAAAQLFAGEHNFAAFAAADERYKRGASTIRRIHSSAMWRAGDQLEYLVRGSGFLKHMVRNMVGTLLEVGKGNVSERALKLLLTGAGRCGATSPACGLFLVNVEYPEKNDSSISSSDDLSHVGATSVSTNLDDTGDTGG